MTLLGLYFSTYFMPLHIDLLVSSLEDIIFESVCRRYSYFTTAIPHTHINNPDRFTVIFDDKPYVIGDIYCVLDEKNVIGARSLEKITDNIYQQMRESKFEKGFIGNAASIPIKLHITSNDSASYNKAIVSTDNSVFETPIIVKDNIALLDVYISKEGKHTIGINLVKNDGSIISNRINVRVLNPSYDHFDLYVMKQKEYPSDHQYKNNDIVDFQTWGNTLLGEDYKGVMDILDNIYYPISSKHKIAFGLKGTVKNPTILPEDYIMHVTTDTDGKYKMYTICNPDKDVHYDECDDSFEEIRFIPAMWEKDLDANLTDLDEDSIFICKPHNSLYDITDKSEWIITNKSTGKQEHINSIIAPIFGVSLGPGIYSIELNVDCKDNHISYKKDHAFRINKKTAQ